jgi:hypothetical protein
VNGNYFTSPLEASSFVVIFARIRYRHKPKIRTKRWTIFVANFLVVLLHVPNSKN